MGRKSSALLRPQVGEEEMGRKREEKGGRKQDRQKRQTEPGVGGGGHIGAGTDCRGCKAVPVSSTSGS